MISKFSVAHGCRANGSAESQWEMSSAVRMAGKECLEHAKDLILLLSGSK